MHEYDQNILYQCMKLSNNKINFKRLDISNFICVTNNLN